MLRNNLQQMREFKYFDISKDARGYIAWFVPEPHVNLTEARKLKDGV